MKLTINFVQSFLLAVFAMTANAQNHLPECVFFEKSIVSDGPCYGIRKIEVFTETYNIKKILTGTITATKSATTLYGFGTKFQSELQIGDFIIWINDADARVKKIVTGIPSQTELEVEEIPLMVGKVIIEIDYEKINSAAFRDLDETTSDETTKASFFLMSSRRSGMPPGTIYKGEFLHGMSNGYGVLTLPNGSKYVGNWRNEKKHGRGTYRWPDGRIYNGNWTNDEMNGYGTMIYSKPGLILGIFYRAGDLYIGNWKNNEMNGKGVFIWSSGEKYTGNFINSRIQGKGTKIYKDRRVFKGNFSDGFYNGYGTLTWPDGYQLIGEWKNFSPSSSSMFKGIFTLNDGTVYEGEWKKDKFHGNGKITYSNGVKYQGKWLEGRRFGKGTLVYPDGREFKGEFSEGFLGNGIYKFGNLIEFWNGLLFWTYSFKE